MTRMTPCLIKRLQFNSLDLLYLAQTCQGESEPVNGGSTDLNESFEPAVGYSRQYNCDPSDNNSKTHNNSRNFLKTKTSLGHVDYCSLRVSAHTYFIQNKKRTSESEVQERNLNHRCLGSKMPDLLHSV